MNHIHFKEIESTQNYLRSEILNLSKGNSQILVSTDEQTNGIGRKENKWVDSLGSIAFSFTIPNTDKLSLIPLWISLTIQEFFKQNYNQDLQLKWPNDLYFKNKKCGGVICHKHDEYIIVGVGMNLYSAPEKLHDELNQAGHMDIDQTMLDNEFKKNIPNQIYSFVLAKKFEPEKIPELFGNKCMFMGEKVKISDDSDLTKGKFVGIGEWGEALIKNDQDAQVAKIYNGSMRKKD